MAHYSIKDIETLSGVKAHTLRIWEQRYDFLKPERTDTNIRFYNDDQLKKILNISLLNRNGFKISRIAEMTDADMKKQVTELTHTGHNPDDLLDTLTQSMVDFDEHRFEKYLTLAITKYGFEKAFSETVFPFLIRTGILWSIGTIRPVQEHFVTNLIRRKIMVAIDGQFVEPNTNSRRFMLFLPEGETHDLMLLFMEYVLRKNNHEVANVGNSLPFDDIDLINDVFRPDYLVTYITIAQLEIPLPEYITKLSKAYRTKTILMGGRQMEVQQPKLARNVQVVNSITNLLEVIK